jgi:hypothetical protein
MGTTDVMLVVCLGNKEDKQKVQFFLEESKIVSNVKLID